MLSKRDIIVLNLIKHSDKGLVVQCYSLQKGRESLYFKGGGKNKQLLLSLHKLALLSIVVYESNGSLMPTIKEIMPAQQLAEIRTNVYKSAIAIFLSELIIKTIKEEEPNEPLFALINSSVRILEAISSGASNFHLYFMVNLSMALGYTPHIMRAGKDELFYIPSGRFEPMEKFTHEGKTEGGRLWFTLGESELMETLLTSKASEIDRIKCNGELRYSFSKKMIEYLSYHLGCEIEIKSLDVLHQVFV